MSPQVTLFFLKMTLSKQSRVDPPAKWPAPITGNKRPAPQLRRKPEPSRKQSQTLNRNLE